MKRNGRVAAAVVVFFVSGASAELAGHWTFDEAGAMGGSPVVASVGADGVFDSGGDGELHSVEGVQGNALSLDGDDFVDLSANAAALSGMESGSISFWFKKPEGFGVLFAASDSFAGSTEMRLFDWANGRITVESRVDEVTRYRVQSKPRVSWADGKWHHLAAVSGQRGWRLYIDGKSVGVVNIAGVGFFGAIPNLDSINIGRNMESGGGQWFYTGLIDELRIYDHELTAGEVAVLARRP
jgi:sialidase-1